MYHVHVDNRVPYWIYSNRQDDGTMRGPRRVRSRPATAGCPTDSTMPAAAGRPGGTRRWCAAAAGSAGVDGGNAGPAWQPNIGGCESGFTIPDPTDADVVYASCYGNKVTRWDAQTGTARSIEPWMVSLDSPPNEVEVPLPLDRADGDRSVRSRTTCSTAAS